METFLTTIGVVFLIEFILKNTFKNTIHQMNISLYGIHKMPKVILELANINKNNVGSYTELSKEEQEKYKKIYGKIYKAIFCTLTYIPSHNLIHIQKDNRSYFHKVSNDDPYLIYEELGELQDKKELYYILYRKDNGWLQGAVLIGYLLKKTQLGEEKEVIHLFEFPEKLIKRRFLTKSLQKKYNLKDDTIADYIDRDELGYSRGIYMASYETENKEDANFWFRIY